MQCCCGRLIYWMDCIDDSNNQFDVRMPDYILILFNINIILELVVQQSRSLELIFSRMTFLYVLFVCVRDPLLRS